MTKQLSDLSDDALFNWFTKNASYHADAPSSSHQYSIRVGSKILYDADTRRLLQKLKDYVRQSPR